MFLSGGTQGDIAKKLLKENISEAESAVSFYQEFFPDHFYLSLSRTGRLDEERYIQAALKLAEKHDLPLVATNDVVFLAPDDFEAHEIRVAIHDGYTLDDPKRPNVIPSNNISAQKKRCATYLRTFLLHLKIRY